jgi:D-arabinose 1-dehydrogenase-like Zn-dependent alcohol dehydrogenase
MRAAVLEEFGEPLVVQEVENPRPSPDGVVVSVDACGVCRSDWHGWQGHWGWLGSLPEPGQIFGHEATGTVVEVGPEVDGLSEGQPVAVSYNYSDGTCRHCRRGHSNNCENRALMGFSAETQGAFAEEVAVPNADLNVIPRPDGVDALDVAALGCRYMVAFHSLVDRADLYPGDWVAVHGCGGVGLSAVQIADALGANVVAVDIREDKLAFARELGAQESVNASETDDVPGAIRERTGGGGADVSVEALGIAETTENSVRCLDTLGQHVQIGLTTDGERGRIELPTDEMVKKEVEFHGSSGIPHVEYDDVFRMVERGTLDPSAIVSRTISLEDVPDALASMSDYDTLGVSVVTAF